MGLYLPKRNTYVCALVCMNENGPCCLNFGPDGPSTDEWAAMKLCRLLGTDMRRSSRRDAKGKSKL